MVKCLLNKGIDINNKGRDGITFIQFANKIGWFNILNVIEGISVEEEEEKAFYIVMDNESKKALSEQELKKLFENDIEMYNMLLGREKNYYDKQQIKNEEYVIHNSYGIAVNNHEENKEEQGETN